MCKSEIRLLSLLWSMDRDVPATTWQLVEAILGRETAASYGPNKARHWCAKAIAHAERIGVIARLPVKAPSRVSRVRKYKRRVDKELLWRITEQGVRFRELKGRIDIQQPPCSDVFQKGGNEENSMAEKAKKCAKVCDKPCDKPCAKTEDKCAKVPVAEVVKKLPAWLAKAKKELEQLIERLNKIDEWIAKIISVCPGAISWTAVSRARGTKAEVRELRLLWKQREAMRAYKEALEARIADAEK